MIHHDDEYDTEYRFVMTNKDLDRITILIALLSDAIYDLFKVRELGGNLVIDETPDLNEMKYHEELHGLQKEIEHHRHGF